MVNDKKSGGLLQRAESLKNQNLKEAPNVNKKEGLLHKAELLSGKEKADVKAEIQPVVIQPAVEKSVVDKKIVTSVEKNMDAQKVELKKKETISTTNRTPFIKINPFEKNEQKEGQRDFYPQKIENPVLSEEKSVDSEVKIKKEKHIKKTEKKKAKPMNKMVFKILFTFFVVLFFMAGLYFGYKKITDVTMEKSHALVDRQLVLCQEFVTAKYKYSDVVIVKKQTLLAKSYSIVKYSGVIRAGIEDLSKVDYSISKNGKSIMIVVPRAEVISDELLTLEVFDETQNIFIPIKTQEIFDEIEEARKDSIENMISEGVLEDARNQAVKLISQFLYSVGFEEVIIH